MPSHSVFISTMNIELVSGVAPWSLLLWRLSAIKVLKWNRIEWYLTVSGLVICYMGWYLGNHTPWTNVDFFPS